MALHSQWSGNKLQFYDGSQVILEIDGTNAAVNWPTGSKITVNGSDITSSLAAGSVAGVASGYKLARSAAAITPVAAQTTIVSGLGLVVAAFVSFAGAQSLTHMWSWTDIGNQAGAPVAGSFYINHLKPTATGDVTPTDASTPWSKLVWVAIGTS